MKGIIFNLLEEIVREEHGEDAWDDLLDAADLDGVYTSLGNYPDAQLHRLVAAAAAALSLSADEVLVWAGRRTLPLMAGRFPHFFDVHTATRPFLLTLNSIIHPEVRKLYPGADTPEFDFDTSDPDTLVMHYRSARRLCAYAQGLVEGVAEHYGQNASFVQNDCMHRGDPACVFQISFSAVLPVLHSADLALTA